MEGPHIYAGTGVPKSMGSPKLYDTGTERNEMEKSVKRVDSGAVQVRSRCIETEIETSGPDEARRTAGRQARHRVHFSWTQSNAGVWTPSNAEAEGPSC